MKTDYLVVGDGWTASSAVAFLLRDSKSITWVSGSASRLRFPLPVLESGPAMDFFQELTKNAGLDAGEITQGSLIREFKNKSFKPPVWEQEEERKNRETLMADYLWAPELRIAPAFASRFDESLVDLEEGVRNWLLAHPKVKRLEGVSLASIEMPEKAEENKSGRVSLTSGEELDFGCLVFADDWGTLRSIEGFPESFSGSAGRDVTGALQVTFTHKKPVGLEMQDGFMVAPHRDAGSEQDKFIWGMFFDCGRKSRWTILLEENEAEDNRVVARKIRRIKQTLNRSFSGSEWASEVKPIDPSKNAPAYFRSSPRARVRKKTVKPEDFASNIEHEHVLLEAGCVFAKGKAIVEPVEISEFSKSRSRFLLLTDGYGPSSALIQVSHLGKKLGLSESVQASWSTNTQGEGVNINP